MRADGMDAVRPAPLDLAYPCPGGATQTGSFSLHFQSLRTLRTGDVLASLGTPLLALFALDVALLFARAATDSLFPVRPSMGGPHGAACGRVAAAVLPHVVSDRAAFS